MLLEDRVSLEPKDVNNNILSNIFNSLKKNYENKVVGRIDGYILDIIKMSNKIDFGHLNNINGILDYKIKYYASVFIPVTKQILKIIITDIERPTGILNDYTDIKGIPSMIPNCNSSILCLCKKDLVPNVSKKQNNYENGMEISMFIEDIKIEYSNIFIIGYIVNQSQ